MYWRNRFHSNRGLKWLLSVLCLFVALGQSGALDGVWDFFASCSAGTVRTVMMADEDASRDDDSDSLVVSTTQGLRAPNKQEEHPSSSLVQSAPSTPRVSVEKRHVLFAISCVINAPPLRC
jgi:hypothetical protein